MIPLDQTNAIIPPPWESNPRPFLSTFPQLLTKEIDISPTNTQAFVASLFETDFALFLWFIVSFNFHDETGGHKEDEDR
jgi:hypothetical protein